MPRHPIELARKHYEELPVVLKQALFSTEIAEQMFEIGKKFGLTIEKTGIMAEETGYIMLGLARPNELVGNLAAELGVDSDRAQDIGAEISHQIFFPLREELKRTHNFDMAAGEVVGSGGATRASGMRLPPGIKKTLVEERSPLVVDLTRVREIPAPPVPPKPPAPIIPAKPALSFQPPVAPTGRIDDLQKMVEKPSLPRPAPELFTSPSRNLLDLKTLPKKQEDAVKSPSEVEPWEKDMEKEVSSILTPKPPLIVPPLQKPLAAPQLPIQSKLPPIDLRPTTPAPPPPPVVSAVEPPPPQATPSVTRMTPQLQDLAIKTSAQDTSKSLPSNEIGPTLLEEKLRLEPQAKAAAPKIIPAPTLSVGVPTPEGVGTGSDPYREPVDETNI